MLLLLGHHERLPPRNFTSIQPKHVRSVHHPDFSIIYTHVAQFPFLSLNFTHPLAVCSNLNAQVWLLRAVPRTHPALLQRNKRRKSRPRSPPADRFRVDAVRSGERSFRKRPAVPVPAAGQEAP